MKDQEDKPKLIYRILVYIVLFAIMVAVNYGGMYLVAIRNDMETDGIFTFALLGAIMAIPTMFIEKKKGK